MEKFETMPEGWRRDRTWGSPEYGWEPICDGRSRLLGGRKGLLRINPCGDRIPYAPLKYPEHTDDTKPVMTKQEIQEAAEVTNNLARAKFKQLLLRDITVDLTVCRLEGWDHTTYVTELKTLIDDVVNDVIKPSS